MKKLLYILFGLVLPIAVIGCRSREDEADAKVMANKEEFIEILRSTGRPGMENVIRQLEMTDFFTRGAGSHHTKPGGLVRHSLETYRIMKSIAWFQPSGSIAIVSLFHDMGKIDYGGWHPWRSVKHLREWGLELSDKEFYAIFYHHKPGLKYFRSPLRRALSVADALSTGWWKLWHRAPKTTSQEEGIESGPHDVQGFISFQLQLFPESRAQDFYKGFCQDNLGPEHLIPDPSSAARYLKEELRTYREDLENHRYEAPKLRYYPVGDEGNYVRVDLSVILDGLVGEEAFLDAFVRSANEGKKATAEEWVRKWQGVSRILLLDHKEIPEIEKDLATLDSLVAGGHYIMRHSQAFRDAYHPHYRIIDREVFSRELKPLIDRNEAGDVR